MLSRHRHPPKKFEIYEYFFPDLHETNEHERKKFEKDPNCPIFHYIIKCRHYLVFQRAQLLVVLISFQNK